jgi:nucleotide-binding universal stress UspA family protein
VIKESAMNASPEHAVVVGIDTSPHAEQALDWAADEAARRGAPLHIAHAWIMTPYQVPPTERGDIAQDYVQAARTLVQQAQDRVLAQHPGLDVSTELLTHGAVPGLVAAAEHADLLVVASRGHNRLASTLLGSVSLGLSAHAPCPVVVVKDHPASAPEPGGDGEGHDAVVLGAAPGQAPAPVEFAFSEAARRGVPLRVIRTWMYPQAYPGIVAVPAVEEATRTREETADLTDVLAAARKAFPDVQVDQRVLLDEADAALVDASRGACLLVLGAERHQRRFTMPIGPTTHRVLHHAHCPVAVVPHT